MRIARLVAIAAGLQIVLMLAGFVLPYDRAFRAVGNAVFDRFGADRVARFDAFEDPTGMHDTRISIGREGEGYPKGLSVNSLRVGWTPTALILALLAATPGRRWRHVGAAFAATQAYVFLRLWLTLAWGFSATGMLELSDHAAWLVRRLQQTLSGDLHISWIAPTLIWAVVCRKPIAAALYPGSSSSSPATDESRKAAASG